MADEKPVIVRKQAPREPPAFEQDLDARIAKRRAAFEQAHPDVPAEIPPAPSTTEPLDLKVETPPAELPEPKEDTPPPVQEPPAPQPPPAETKPPVEPPPEKKPFTPSNEDWAAWRKTERENRRLRQELEKLKATPPATPQPPAQPQRPVVPPPEQKSQEVVDDDPFGIKATVKAETEAALARIRDENAAQFQTLEQREQQQAVQRYQDELTATERQYSEKDPDYYPAVNHLVNWERQRFQLSGMAQNRAAQMLNDAKFQPVIEKIADEYVFVPDPNREGVLLTTKRDQLTPELRAQAREMSDAEAAIALATDLWVAEQRNNLLQSNRPSDIPSVVMKLATSVAGYQPRPRESAANPQPSPNGRNSTPPPSAAERIRQQARVNAASKSVANLSSGMPGEPQPQQIRSLSEWVDFHRRDPQAARAYADRMSRLNPNWHRDLQA